VRVAAKLALCCCCGSALGTAASDANYSPYRLEQEIALPGEGAWDYLSIDPAGRRLYVAHGDHVDVVDIDRNALVGRIADTPGVHGFAVAAALGRGYASDGHASQISVVDLKSLQTLAHVNAGSNPDAIVFEPNRGEVYAFNGRANSATVIDARSAEVLATIELPGKPEFAVADPEAERIYDNIEDQNLVVAIDARTHAIVDRWPTAPGEGPTGMALDSAHHRLFVACHNQRMVMLDTHTGQVIATVAIGQGVDASAFDPATRLAFASNGEGTVSIVRESGPDALAPVQTLVTRASARTIALDPASHRIYLASGTRALPDSVRILVYGPTAAH
jgi:DNA-binding beta-propeller fold protein YncE